MTPFFDNEKCLFLQLFVIFVKIIQLLPSQRDEASMS